MVGDSGAAMHCYFSGSKGLRLWQDTAFAGGRGLVGAGVHGYFPGTVGDLFPDGKVAAGDGDGLVVLVFGMTLVVAPGEAHVIGATPLGSLRGPGDLVVLGVPLGLGAATPPPRDCGAAVIDGHTVLAAPRLQ